MIENRIRAIREEKGMSQEQLAAQAGMRTATLSSIENNHNAELATFEKIATALDVHILELFKDNRDDPETKHLLDLIRALTPEDRAAVLKLLSR